MYGSKFRLLNNNNIKDGEEYYTVEITGDVCDADYVDAESEFSKEEFENDICVIISYLLCNCMNKNYKKFLPKGYQWNDIYLKSDDGDYPITEDIPFPDRIGDYEWCHTLEEITVTYHCKEGNFVVDNNDIIKQISCERIFIKEKD